MTNKKILNKIIKSKWFLNIFLPFFSIILALYLSRLVFTKNYLIFAGLFALLILVFILFNKEIFSKIKTRSLLKLLFWLTIITAVTGVAFLSFPFGPYHLFPFRIFLPLTLLLIFLQILLNQGKLAASLKKIKFYLSFLVVWFSYAILTLGWALSKAAVLKELYFLFVGLAIIFLIVLYLRKLKDFKNFYILWMFLLVFLMGIGLWEMFTGNRLPHSGYFGTIWANKKIWPTAVFHNTNDFASFLALSIPFVWAWLRYGKGKMFKWLPGVTLFAGTLFLLSKTFSRVNFLAVALEIIFILFCLLKTNKKVRVIFAIALIAILAFIIYPPLFSAPSNFFENLTSPYALTHGSVGARINVIKNSLWGLFNTYGFGVGAGNTENYIAHFAKYPIIGGILSLHNWWMEILANYGIFIFTGYLLFYFGLIYNLWKIWHRINERQEKMICEALLVALVGFLLASIGPSSMIQLKYQWIFFGFILAFLNYYRIRYPKIKKKQKCLTE